MLVLQDSDNKVVMNITDLNMSSGWTLMGVYSRD